jgi:hypothetical protein
MKTVAEQIRALSQQIMELEAPTPSANPEVQGDEKAMAAGDIKPVASVQAPAQAAVDPDKYKPKDKIPEVQGSSFSQAMANAIKQGLKPGDKFRWCSVYGTKIGKKRPQVNANPAQPDPFSRYGGGQNLNGSPVSGITDKLREAVASLTTQLNELAYGQPDPKNPGFMWVPADGTSPLGDGQTPKQMIGTGTDGYVNAKMVPITASKPPEATTPPVTTTPPATTPTTTPEAPPSVTPTEPGKTEQPCDPETLAKIKYMPSFNQAFAAARQAGCDQFAWCGVFTVKKEQDSNPETPPAAVGNPSMFFKNVSAWIAQAQRRIGQKPHDAPYSRQEIDAVVKQIKDSGTIEWNGQAERAIRYRMQTGKPMPVLTPGQQLGPNTTFPSTFSPNK